jgi:hypothetical protein
MDKYKQLFTHESVDDEIDQLINNRFSLSSDPDTQLLRELHDIYKEDADSLKRVWERLEPYSRQQHTAQDSSLQTRQRLAVGSHIVPFNKRNSNHIKYPARQLFTVLAATIIGVFLISSMAWILASTYPTAPGAMRRIPGNFVLLTVHNDKSGQTNYITITGGNSDPKAPVFCQPVPPSNWIDVRSSPDVPVQIPTGQIIRLQYFHSPKCDPLSRFLSVDLPIPIEPAYNQCWFNPDNTNTPNWSGCVRPSQILPIHWY